MADPPPLRFEIEHTRLPSVPLAIPWMRREPDAVAPPDLPALDWVRPGSALDLGCCTGRHLEILAERGVRGHGIDLSTVALEMAAAAGISCEAADWSTYLPPEPVDSLLLLGGNGGLVLELERLPDALARLSSWLRPGGSIVFTSVDWTRVPELAGGAGRAYPGDLRMRFHLGDSTGPWFRWLFADPRALGAACARAGLRISEMQFFGTTPAYGALLIGDGYAG